MMKIDKFGWAAVTAWMAAAVLVGLALHNLTWMPVLLVALSIACTMSGIAVMRPHLMAADEVYRLGIEVGERRARKTPRPVVVPLYKERRCRCGGLDAGDAAAGAR